MPGDDRAADRLREAVVLSLALGRAALRGALVGAGASSDEADQRRLPGLDELQRRLADPPPAVAARLPELRARAAQLVERAARAGVQAVVWRQPEFPSLLAAIDDPPPVLWVRGDAARLADPAVAVVGSRRGSPYACTVAEQLAAGLAARGVAVVSGLARGVDAAAHRGALAGGGATLAVLGSGVDVVYPREHTALADEVAGQGALVSELGPGAPPLRQHFPRRNRILSGLARGVVVVEAAARSGSLITARLAAEQGREVMAVPGNVLGGRSRGAHRLIRDGARLVETADDVLEEIGAAPAPAASASAAAARAAAEEPDPVLARMEPGDPCEVESLAARSGLSAPALLTRLTELEIEGRVARIGPGRFVRLAPPMVT